MVIKNDTAVVTAMGSKFEAFRKLALMVKESPSTRKYAEAEMARILETMTPAERLTLRRALITAGVR